MGTAQRIGYWSCWVKDNCAIVSEPTLRESRMITSEVHVNNELRNPIKLSRYSLTLPSDLAVVPIPEDSLANACAADTTEPARRRSKNSSSTVSITMHHECETGLDDVGLQIWNAAFLLCEHLLDSGHIVKDSTLVELGCGAGLVAIVSSLLGARAMYYTDYKQEILDLAARNIALNNHIASNLGLRSTPTYPCLLDWTSLSLFNLTSLHATSCIETNQDMRFLLAADVIYDDTLTASFFSAVLYILRPNDVLWLALEKRFNFSLEQMELVANGYSLFLEHISNGQLRGRMLHLPNHHFHAAYERSADVELWEIVKNDDVM